jgi:hypothetical protein
MKSARISSHHPIDQNPISLSDITPGNDNIFSSGNEFLSQKSNLQLGSSGGSRLALFQYQMSETREKKDFHAGS